MERLGGYGAWEHQQDGVRKAREQYWPGTLMAAGLLVLIGTFWTGQLVTLITFTAMFRWLAVFCFAGNLLPYMRTGLAMGMERLEWFLFNLLAVGPFVFSGLLWANFLFRGPSTTYLVDGDLSRLEFIAYWHEHQELPPGRKLQDLPSLLREEEVLKGYAIAPLVRVAPGALGYAVIDGWETSQVVHLSDLGR
jgi:hypothetical protein